MFVIRTCLVTVLLMLVGVSLGNASADVTLPALGAPIQDRADMFRNSTWRSNLDGLVESYKDRTGGDVYIVTVKTLQGKSAADYASLVAMHWGFQTERETGRLLLVFSETERAIGVAVDKRLQETLPLTEAEEMLRVSIEPVMQDGLFALAARHAVHVLTERLARHVVVFDQRVRIMSPGVLGVITMLLIVFMTVRIFRAIRDKKEPLLGDEEDAHLRYGSGLGFVGTLKTWSRRDSWISLLRDAMSRLRIVSI